MPSDNKRIAKNTLLIYIRTFIVLFVSLYTSRLVLEVLGAEDLGIYNVVGGIVAMMSFFQTSQAKATSRFITYELGCKSDDNVMRRVFSICMTIHIFIAFAVIGIGETIGLWIIEKFTEIPIERQNAAMWVYQLGLFVFCIHLIRVPYDAIVVAYEKMSMYAYVSIIEAALQLGLVYIIINTNVDSLILYSALMALTAFILYVIYYIYVKTTFKIYSFSFIWDKGYGKKVLSFSGWTFLGSGANTATQQGVNLLINNFVGLVANAALGFSSQVNIAVSKFVNGFSTAFTPQIIKLYAQRDFQGLNSLIFRSSKFSFLLCYLMVLPLICNMDFILHIWLGENIPKYTLEFCRLILVCTAIDATTGVYNTSITATGNIKAYQICISISFVLDLICCSILLLFNYNPVIVFVSRIATRGLINMAIGLSFLKYHIDFSIRMYMTQVVSSIFITILVSAIPTILLMEVTSGWLRFILTTLCSSIIIVLTALYVIMTKGERELILNKVKSKINVRA